MVTCETMLHQHQGNRAAKEVRVVTRSSMPPIVDVVEKNHVQLVTIGIFANRWIHHADGGIVDDHPAGLLTERQVRGSSSIAGRPAFASMDGANVGTFSRGGRCLDEPRLCCVAGAGGCEREQTRSGPRPDAGNQRRSSLLVSPDAGIRRNARRAVAPPDGADFLKW